MGGPQLAAVAIVGSVLSAKAQMDAGKAQRYQYEVQARQAEIKGRQDAITYKEQGNQVLRERRKIVASAIAKGGASGFNFTEAGSPTDIAIRQTDYAAVKDFTIARDNATMAVKMAQFNASSLLTAGQNIQQTSQVAAMGSLLTGVGQAGQIYGTKGFKKG